MMQAPHAALFGEMRMRRMSRKQLVERRSSRIEAATVQSGEDGADAPRKRYESRNVSLRQLRDRGWVDGENARESGHGFARRRRHLAFVVRCQLVDQLGRHQQAGVFVTV